MSVTLKFSIPSAEASWTTKSANVFAQKIEEQLPHVKVNVVYGGKLYKQGEELAALQKGDLDLATVSFSDLGEPFNALSRAYLIKDYEHLRRVVEISTFWPEFCSLVSEKLGITILSVIYIGTRHLAEIGEKQFQNEDFALRMPKGEAWAQVAKSLGTNPIPISLHDLPKAIQEGQIDGIDSPLPALKAYNLEIKRLVLTSHLVDFILMVKSNKTTLQSEEESALCIASEEAQRFNDLHRREVETNLLLEYAQTHSIVEPNLKELEEKANAYYRKHLQLSQEQQVWIEAIKQL